MQRSELKNLRVVPNSQMFEVRPGSMIAKVIDEAVALSVSERHSFIMFEYNGVLMMVRGSESDPKALLRDYRRACKGYIVPRVGPYVSKVLSGEEKKNDTRIRVRNKRKHPHVRVQQKPSAQVSL